MLTMPKMRSGSRRQTAAIASCVETGSEPAAGITTEASIPFASIVARSTSSVTPAEKIGE